MATNFPLGLKTALTTGALMRQRLGNGLPGFRVPDSGRSVLTSSDHPAAIGAENRLPDDAGVLKNAPTGFPVLASQIRAVWSRLAVTTYRPFRLKWAVVTGPSWNSIWIVLGHSCRTELMRMRCNSLAPVALGLPLSASANQGSDAARSSSSIRPIPLAFCRRTSRSKALLCFGGRLLPLQSFLRAGLFGLLFGRDRSFARRFLFEEEDGRDAQPEDQRGAHHACRPRKPVCSGGPSSETDKDCSAVGPERVRLPRCR